MYSWISHWPVWELLRLSGVVSYLILLAGICLGIVYSLPVWKGKPKARLFTLHTTAVNTGTLIGLLHGILPVISTYMPFRWGEVLIPFAAHDHKVLNGIGTLAGYALLLLILTSDLRTLLGRRLWYMTHLLAYPMFVLVWIHGYFIGTDTSMVGMRWMYLLSIVLIAGLTAFRFLVPKPERRPRQAVVSR